MDEAGAVEEDVDRADRPRESVDGIRRQHVEAMQLGAVDAVQRSERFVGGDDAGALRDEGHAVARPMPAAAAVKNAVLPARRPAIARSPN